MNKRFLIAALFIFCSHLYVQNASAEGTTYVYTGAWSKHVGTSQEYNETHNFLAVEYKGIMAGYFKNSYSTDSAVAGYRFKRQWGDFDAGLLVGATWGYTHCLKGEAEGKNKRTCPVVVPSIAYTKYKAQPALLVLGNAIAFSIRWEI